MKYVKGLDTLRALAIFFVIMEHWGHGFPANTIPNYLLTIFLENGTFGVNLFFVLSGFLITSILLNEKTKLVAGKQLTVIKNFFIRRSLRIFPIYYIVILTCYFLGYTFVQENIGYYLTYTSNLLPYRTGKANVLSHTWSLSVEEQFYLIWPWLIIFVNWKYIKYVFIGSIVLGIVSRFVVVNVWHHHYPVLVFNCLDAFGIGGAYAYIRLKENWRKNFEKNFLIVFPLLLYVVIKTASFKGNPLCVTYKSVLDSVIAVALIMFTLKNKSEWIRKYIMENKVFNFVGRISYGLYLYHFTFGYAADRWVADYMIKHPDTSPFINNDYFVFCAKLVILVSCSWLSFIIIEKPILTLKKKFEYT